MHDIEFIRRLQLDNEKYDALLKQLDATPAVARSDQRSRPRLDYPVPDVGLSIDHQHGGSANFLVFGRNVSSAGISILHGGYIHAGSECRVMLASRSGRTIEVAGEVRYCRLVGGSCHEIGIRFHEEIDTALLRGVGGESADASESVQIAESARRKLSGRILLADTFMPDLVLLRYQLGMHGPEILLAKTPGAALDTLRREPVDVVVSGLSITTEEGVRTLANMRDLGFDGAIIVLSAESDPIAIRRAWHAGATEVMPKPYNLDVLLAQLESVLRTTDVPKRLYSTATDQPGMPSLIARYVQQVRDLGEDAKEAYNEGDWATLDAICTTLKGSGCGYGFQEVTSAAINALRRLNQDRTSDAARIAVARVIECCRAMAQSDATDETEATISTTA